MRIQHKGHYVGLFLLLLGVVSMAVSEKALAAELMERLEARHTGGHFFANHTYEPHGIVKQVYESTEPELLVSGPAGTGKSRGILEKVNSLMWQYPKARTLIVRKTRKSLSESTLVTFEDEVLGEDNPILLGRGGRRLERQSRTNYQYPNGSRIVLGGMDNPTKVLSSQYDIIYAPELIEFELVDLETLITRLRNYVIPWQQFIADTNPSHERHWAFLRCKSGLMKILFSTHKDNPRLYDREKGEWTDEGRKYVLGTLNNLTGVRRLRLLDGKWVSAEGAVYENWDDAIHIIDRFDIPPEWRRIVSIDFGHTNPFTAQWWAIDHDGRMYLYREIYMTKRTVRAHCETIHRCNAGYALQPAAWDALSDDEKRNAIRHGERIEAYVADHDAEDRATMQENGIVTVPAKKAITVGIEKFQDRLNVAGDGKPRLMVMRDSLVEIDTELEEAKKPIRLIDEIPGYMYPEGVDGKPVKELPIDLDNHGCDAGRYAVMYLDGAQKSSGKMVKVNIR